MIKLPPPRVRLEPELPASPSASLGPVDEVLLETPDKVVEVLWAGETPQVSDNESKRKRRPFYPLWDKGGREKDIPLDKDPFWKDFEEIPDISTR